MVFGASLKLNEMMGRFYNITALTFSHQNRDFYSFSCVLLSAVLVSFYWTREMCACSRGTR